MSRPVVLIVDADPRFCESRKRELLASGFDVLVSDVGESALLTALRARPDLVLIGGHTWEWSGSRCGQATPADLGLTDPTTGAAAVPRRTVPDPRVAPVYERAQAPLLMPPAATPPMGPAGPTLA